MCRQCRIDEGKPLSDPHTYCDEFGRYRRIALSRGLYALIDPERYDDLSQFNWQAHPSNGGLYARRAVADSTKRGGQRLVFMHHDVAGPGRWDHRNVKPLDNRRDNLRSATNEQNGCNKSKRRSSRCTSRYKGVSWHKKHRVWVVRITVAHRTLYIGCFPKEHERMAAEAYNRAALVYHGEFARLNVV